MTSERVSGLPKVRTHPWHDLAHHRADGGFRNVWPPYRDGSVFKGMKWFLGRAFRSKENRLPPVRALDAAELRQPSDRTRLTWIGHATMLIQTRDHTLLTDPMFGRRASLFSFAGPERMSPLPIELNQLPPVDVVLISHDHYDHLDTRSIEELIRLQDPLFLAPLGVARYLHEWGSDRVVETDWWQYVDFAGARYHCVPAKHFSGRTLHGDGTLWAGWYVESGADRIYYAGDTGYAPIFGQIRERLGPPGIALLPIGAYLPQWLMHPVHVRPDEAIQAFREVGAEHFIAMHWGTFDLADEPLHEPADTLRQLARESELEDRVHVLDIGGIWSIGSAGFTS